MIGASMCSHGIITITDDRYGSVNTTRLCYCRGLSALGARIGEYTGGARRKIHRRVSEMLQARLTSSESCVGRPSRGLVSDMSRSSKDDDSVLVR